MFSADEATIKDNPGDTGPLNNPEVPLSSHFPADWPPPWGGAQTARSWDPSTWDPGEPPPLPWVLAPQGPPAGRGEAQVNLGTTPHLALRASLGRPGGGAAHLQNLLRGVLIDLKLDFCSD